MKKIVNFLLVLLSTLLFSVSTYGNTDLGEYCFAGNFVGEGNCLARLEIVQHAVNYSILGNIDCTKVADSTDPNGNISISGIVNGTGFVKGSNFVGGLTMTREFGQVGVNPGGVYNDKAVALTVNLSNLQATFRQTKYNPTANDACASTPPGATWVYCSKEAVFSYVACPK